MNHLCLFCTCGKLCTSKAGLTLHQVKCKDAKAAKKEGKPVTRDTDIIIPRDDYCAEIKEFIELADLIAYDSDMAMRNHNKSAGRRARNGLIKLRNMVTPLRKKIMDKIKG